MKTYEIEVPVVSYVRVRVNGNTPKEAMESLMKSGECIDWDYCEGITDLKYMIDCPELYDSRSDFYCHCEDDDTTYYLIWDTNNKECYVNGEDDNKN